MDRLRAANGNDGILGRVRTDTRLLIAVVAAAILVLAWIGWAIYVASSNGGRAGLGVVIAWPAMLVALSLISLPFIGAYLLIRRLSEDGGEAAPAQEEEEEASEDEPEEEEDSEDEASDEEESGAEESESDEEESETEASSKN